MNDKLKLAIGAAALTLAATASASAADLPSRPVKAPIYAVAAVYNWTGFYVGANLGGAWSNVAVNSNFAAGEWSFNNSNFMLGGQLGYNYQIGQFVLGGEWEFDWANGSKTSGFHPTALGPLQASFNSDWVMTLAARFGFAVDTWLFYAKAGGGWTQVNNQLKNPAGGMVANNSSTNAGWLVGGGIEYAFAQNWTGKIEYSYLGLNDNTFSANGTPRRITVSPNLSMFKVGVNYKF